MDKGTRKGDEIYYDKDDIKDPGLITVELVNSWHDECQNKMGLLPPRDSVEISFDVSGFNYDNPDAVETPALRQKKQRKQILRIRLYQLCSSCRWRCCSDHR